MFGSGPEAENDVDGVVERQMVERIKIGGVFGKGG